MDFPGGWWRTAGACGAEHPAFARLSKRDPIPRMWRCSTFLYSTKTDSTNTESRIALSFRLPSSRATNLDLSLQPRDQKPRRFDIIPTLTSKLLRTTLRYRPLRMTGGKKDAHNLSEGDDVSWKWGSQHPSGTVKEVVDGDAQAKTKKGSTISKEGSKDDPAVIIETANGNNAVKNVRVPAPARLKTCCC